MRLKKSFGNLRRIIGLTAMAVTTLVATAQWATPTVPAFHKSLPRGPLPDLLPKLQRQGVYFSHPYQTAAYAMADRLPELLYQMPCYCRCDLAMRHRSLHSCFEGTHAAVCSTCMSEAAYVYKENAEGKTTAEIRAGIERGDWQEINLDSLRFE